MFDPIFTFFEKLITAFSWRRLIFTVSLLFLIIGGIVLFEYYTGHYRLARIDKAATTLEHLTKIHPDVVKAGDSELTEIFNTLRSDLNGFVGSKRTPFDLPVWQLKVLSAAIPWIFLSVIFASVRDGSSKDSLIGVLILAPIPIIAAAFIPTCPHAWVTYFLIPVVLCILPVLVVAVIGNKIKT